MNYINLKTKAIFSLLLVMLSFYGCRDTDILNHKIILPHRTVSDQPPVIFFLHGWDGTENQLINAVDTLLNEMIVIFLRAPYKTKGKGYEWSSLRLGKSEYQENLTQAEVSRQRINKSITYLIRKTNGDPDRVCIAGLSQGAIMALRVGLNPPFQAKAIICINGRLPKESLPDSIPDRIKETIRFYILNGKNDPLIPYREAELLCDALKEKNINVTSACHNEGHSVQKKMIAGFKPWLVNVLK